MSIFKIIEGGFVRYTATNIENLQQVSEEIMEALDEDETMTVYIVDENETPVSLMTNRRITGEYRKQRWTSRDHAVLVAEESFDATDAILNLPLDEIHALEDDSEDTDAIGNMHIDWDGPHSVWITSSICAYFDVDDISDITQAHIDAARDYEQPKSRTIETLELTVTLNVSMPAFDNDNQRQEMLQQLTENLDYDFVSNTPGAVIDSTEITDC